MNTQHKILNEGVQKFAHRLVIPKTEEFKDMYNPKGQSDYITFIESRLEELVVYLNDSYQGPELQNQDIYDSDYAAAISLCKATDGNATGFYYIVGLTPKGQVTAFTSSKHPFIVIGSEEQFEGMVVLNWKEINIGEFLIDIWPWH